MVMKAVDIHGYAQYLNPDNVDELESGLGLPWFDSCDFESDEWVLVSHKNRQTTYKLSFARDAITPEGRFLTDFPDLLYTVKLFLVLSWAGSKKVGVSISTAEGAYKAYSKVIDFLRYINFEFKINNLRSINVSVVKKLKLDYTTKTSNQRLDVERRCLERLYEIFSDEALLKTYKNEKSERSVSTFDYLRFITELGLSLRSAQNCMDFQWVKYDLFEEHGITQKVKKRPTGVTNCVLSESVIRKNLEVIKGFLNLTYAFSELFPESQRSTEMWLKDIKISKLSKKVATNKGGRTRNIPRRLMYQLMDEAVRWVVDYSDELFLFKLRSDDAYRDFTTMDQRSGKRNRSGKQAEIHHYGSKQMRKWFLDNQPIDFPYNISSVEKGYGENRDEESFKKIVLAKELKEKNWTQKAIAAELGISKSTVSVYLNYVPQKAGTSLHAILNKHLVSACMLVIFAFTGRRKDEIYGLDRGCVEFRGDSYYLRFEQEKIDQGERSLPTTKLVAKAVSVLERLNQKAFIEEGQSKLMRISRMKSGFYQAWPSFNEFCELCGINAVDDEGNKFSFAEHQFRRFIAMTFWYKYPDPDLPTLTWFLGHSDPQMTMKYITDENGLEIMRSVKNERILDLLTEEEQSPEDSVVANEIRGLFDDLDMVNQSRYEVMDKKLELVDSYVLNFVPDGACFGATKGIEDRCQCLHLAGEKIADTAQVSAAKYGSCIGCPNLMSVGNPIKEDDLPRFVANSSPMLDAISSNSDGGEPCQM